MLIIFDHVSMYKFFIVKRKVHCDRSICVCENYLKDAVLSNDKVE